MMQLIWTNKQNKIRVMGISQISKSFSFSQKIVKWGQNYETLASQEDTQIKNTKIIRKKWKKMKKIEYLTLNGRFKGGCKWQLLKAKLGEEKLQSVVGIWSSSIYELKSITQLEFSWETILQFKLPGNLRRKGNFFGEL